MNKLENQYIILQKYVNKQLNLIHNMNIFLNANGRKNYYSEIGKYIIEHFKFKNKPDWLYFHLNQRRHKGLLNIFNKNQTQYIGMHFLTSGLNYEICNKIWGEPLFHSEFGEGFNNKITNEDYASYFIEIDNIILHIGFDHRGTSIEIEEEVSPEKLFDIIKQIINEYVKLF